MIRVNITMMTACRRTAEEFLTSPHNERYDIKNVSALIRAALLWFRTWVELHPNNKIQYKLYLRLPHGVRYGIFPYSIHNVMIDEETHFWVKSNGYHLSTVVYQAIYHYCRQDRNKAIRAYE